MSSRPARADAIEAKHADIEQLVVEHAQSQSVVERIRAVEGEPADMCRLDADAGTSELSVVTAEGALPVPCLQYCGAPAGITAAATCLVSGEQRVRAGQHRRGIKAHRFQHVGGNGFREVACGVTSRIFH
jgi:hypothetical protein